MEILTSTNPKQQFSKLCRRVIAGGKPVVVRFPAGFVQVRDSKQARFMYQVRKAAVLRPPGRVGHERQQEFKRQVRQFFGLG